MDKKEFEENYLFEKYKDTPLKNSKDFKKRVEKYININVSSVYAKIINYQIKTYGATLIGYDIEKTDIEVLNRRAKQRNIGRRKSRGTWENAKEKRWVDYE